MRSKACIFIMYPTIITVVALSVLFLIWKTRPHKCSVYGSITDSLSEGSVYKAQISVADKITFCYLSTEYELAGISPGIYTLTAEALGYYPYSRKIALKRGKNKLDILLKGREITNLRKIYIFSESKQEGIELEIRFANEQNESILHYPCLNMSLSVALYVQKGNHDNYSFGRKLYEGFLRPFWDRQADHWKYKALIPWQNLLPLTLDEKIGIMEVVLEIPDQGEYRTIVNGVKLQ